MSNTRYIEIDSTYRNRSDWPLPANFEVRLSQSGTKGKLDALDPVSLATPLKTWVSNTFSANSIELKGTIKNSSNSGSQKIIIVEFPLSDDPHITKDYYAKSVIVHDTLNKRRRIHSSEFISRTTNIIRMRFTVDDSFGDDAIDGDSVTIIDPTDITTDVNNPQFFIPAGHIGQGSYIRYFMYNDTLSQARQISGYDAITHIATVDTTKSIVAGTYEGPVNDWLNTHSYNIRREMPSFTGTLTASTVSTVTFPIGVSNIDDYYNGNFVRIKQGHETRRIVDYDGTTRVARLYPSFSVPHANEEFEILHFNFDQSVPLNYTGSTISQQEKVCYEITLLNLILPNRILTTGNGNRITFYPYVYVEFSNLSTGSTGVIYSNNPNSNRMLFRVAIDDIPNPLLDPFVKVDGGKMVQTVKFSPNDNLKFSVRLPNGDFFETAQTETVSPLEPNPDMQISAMFSIKRL